MEDSKEIQRALVYFCATHGLRCEPNHKMVPGTDLRQGELP